MRRDGRGARPPDRRLIRFGPLPCQARPEGGSVRHPAASALGCKRADGPQVRLERRLLLAEVVLLPDAQQEGGVDGDIEDAAVLEVDRLAAERLYRCRAAQKALRGGCAERHDHPGFDIFPLEIEPETAGRNFAGIWPLVQPPLPALSELEVLDRIGDVSAAALDPDTLQHPVEKPPGRPRT